MNKLLFYDKLISLIVRSIIPLGFLVGYAFAILYFAAFEAVCKISFIYFNSFIFE